MSKHITPSHFYELPSGLKVHPCRLILKDGTLMWKHALLFNNQPNIPINQAHEQHIIKTAQRLEELNSWVSQELEPWECLRPVAWYAPEVEELANGISVYFKHTLHKNNEVYEILLKHIQGHESLEVKHNYLFFQRC